MPGSPTPPPKPMTPEEEAALRAREEDRKKRVDAALAAADDAATSARYGIDVGEYQRQRDEQNAAGSRGGQLASDVAAAGQRVDTRISDVEAERNRVLGRTAPTVGAVQIDVGPQGEMRGGQQDLIAALQAQMRGEGPESPAQRLLKQGVERSIAANMAMQAAQRGGPEGLLAGRMLNQSAAASRQGLAGQVADLRAQEQLAAQGLLGNVLQGARGQDLGLAANQAGLSQQANLANQEAALKTMGLQEAMAQGYTGQLGNLDVAQRDAMINALGAGLSIEEAAKQRGLSREVQQMQPSPVEQAAAGMLPAAAGGATTAASLGILGAFGLL